MKKTAAFLTLVCSLFLLASCASSGGCGFAKTTKKVSKQVVIVQSEMIALK